MEVNGQLHASADFSLGKKPRYPLDGKLGGLQTRSDMWGREKFLPLRGIEPRSPSGKHIIIRGPLKTFMDWRQCVAVMQK
jgi:hypothetical protein